MQKFEVEKKRELILDLYWAGKSYQHIATEVAKIFKKPCTKSTVQSVVKRFKNRLSVAARVGCGRKTKMTPQYAPAPCFCCIILSVSGTNASW